MSLPQRSMAGCLDYRRSTRLLIQGEGAVTKLARPLVRMDDDPRAGRLGVDKFQSDRHAPLEEALSFAENDRKNHKRYSPTRSLSMSV